MKHTIATVLEAEITLEPIECIFCHEETVVYMQYVGDGHCEACGRWQGADSQNSDDG